MHHWNYFLNIEKELYSTNNIVEFCEDNYAVYSIEYAKLLLSTCSEIDVLFRLLCSTIDTNCKFSDENSRNGNIVEYYKIICNTYPKIIDSELNIYIMDISIKPFENWSENKSPNWWKDYNKVKHYRHSNYKKANLKNCIYSLSALAILNMYLFRIVTDKPYASFSTLPELFDCQYFSEKILCRAQMELPDFQDPSN
jgi:hypothetical protein